MSRIISEARNGVVVFPWMFNSLHLKAGKEVLIYAYIFMKHNYSTENPWVSASSIAAYLQIPVAKVKKICLRLTNAGVLNHEKTDGHDYFQDATVSKDEQ